MASYNKLLIPESINLDVLVEHGGFKEIPGFHVDKLAYILFLIDYVATLSHKYVMEGGYTSLSAVRVKLVVGNNYKDYFDLLVLQGVIEIDRQFIVGEKNMGYKYVKEYAKDFLKVHAVTTITISKHLRELFHPMKNQIEGYNHLTKWYGDRLEIAEMGLALTYCKLRHKLNNYLEDKDSGARWFNTFNLPPLSCREYELLEEADYRRNRKLQFGLHEMEMGWFPLSVDATSYRLHSNLSRLKSELRNALTYSGKQLVSLDIKNSQPYFSLILFDESFWFPAPIKVNIEGILRHKKESTLVPEEDRELTRVFNYHLLPSIKEYINSSNSNNNIHLDIVLIMFLKNSQIAEKQDVVLYFELIVSGRLYEYIANEMTNKGFEVPEDRRSLKAMVFQTLFTDNRFFGQESAKPKRFFKSLFPNVVALFELIKKKNSEFLPILLQTIESYLILQVITKRINREKPRLPIFTIHDSIITTVGNEEYVLSIMEDELKKAIGEKPTIKCEYYTLDTLQKEVDKLEGEISSIEATMN